MHGSEFIVYYLNLIDVNIQGKCGKNTTAFSEWRYNKLNPDSLD